MAGDKRSAVYDIITNPTNVTVEVHLASYLSGQTSERRAERQVL